ncbi:uncharacterized protein G2W53_044401 [Senna tora]|uniref:Uncharacterized protein n=1 Tax=Senna tora TaxID=362788 RepID=A0A834SMT0_9FABA|nr:uncharacterized protein G2W53_044401 [Senna tora]
MRWLTVRLGCQHLRAFLSTGVLIPLLQSLSFYVGIERSLTSRGLSASETAGHPTNGNPQCIVMLCSAASMRALHTLYRMYNSKDLNTMSMTRGKYFLDGVRSTNTTGLHL